MNPKELARIEIEARRMRAQVFGDFIRALFGRKPSHVASAAHAA